MFRPFFILLLLDVSGVAVAQSLGTGTITGCAGTICRSATLTGGNLTYTQVQPAASPSPRCCVGMAFDTMTNFVLLFGGVQGYYSTLGDTWQFAGGTWTQLNPSNSPSPREGPGMADDGATGTIVLFGGSSGLFGGDCCDLNDTWVWNGATWTQINTPGPPPRRFDGQGMAYDPNIRKVIMFGGIVQGNTVLGDTWAWDGLSQTWTEIFPSNSPSPRDGAAIATDRAGNVVLFGGDPGDTWVFNGTTWQEKFPVTSPSPRGANAMVYNRDLNAAVLFGGYGLNDTWVWDGTNWTQIPTAVSPDERYYFGMAYDGSAHDAVIFGGFSVTGPIRPDTWELSLRPK